MTEVHDGSHPGLDAGPWMPVARSRKGNPASVVENGGSPIIPHKPPAPGTGSLEAALNREHNPGKKFLKALGPVSLPRLMSRQDKDLTGWFPELAQAGKFLPRSTVLDGEIVIADGEGRADFGALQRRLGVASRCSLQTAANCPAILLVFDMLE